ncbi:MAG: acyloxyacyl hydrolase [Bacteroidales bacterium]
MKGQEPLPLSTGLSFTMGSIIKNYPVFPSRDACLGAHLELSLKADGRKPWQPRFRYPDVGMLLGHYWLGNEKVLGQVNGLQAFLRIPLSTLPRKGIFYFRPAIGFAWFSKPYDKIENPDNLLAGSHLSNITTLELQYGHILYRNLEGVLGLGFSHFSNGHTSLPNVGTNFPSLSAGIRYVPQWSPHSPDTLKFVKPERWKFNAEVALGMHEFGETTEPTDGRKYPVYGASLFMSRIHGIIHNWSLGFTWNYYTSFYDFIKAEELFASHVRWNASTLIVFGGHEFLAGHVGIDTRVGIYLTNPFRNKYSREIIHVVEHLKLWNTNRLALNFYLNDPNGVSTNAWIGMYIKANAGQADFAGISAGCRF